MRIIKAWKNSERLVFKLKILLWASKNSVSFMYQDDDVPIVEGSIRKKKSNKISWQDN